MNQLNLKFKVLFFFLTVFGACAIFPNANKLKEKSFPRTYEFFPGCFPQPQVILKKDFKLKDYYRSYLMLSEVSTLASFDIMPLCHKTLSFYCIHYLISKGYSPEKAKYSFARALKRQKSCSSQEVVIFVLANICHGNSPGLEVLSSPWKIGVKINNNEYRPEKIEVVRRDEGLKELLGYKFDKLKKIYKLNFSLPQSSLNNGSVFKLVFKYLDYYGETDLPHLGNG